MQGYGDMTSAPTAPDNCTNWWSSSLCQGPPAGYGPDDGIFKGNERYYGTPTLTLEGLLILAGGTWFLSVDGGSVNPSGFFPSAQCDNRSVELFDPSANGGQGLSTVLSKDPGDPQPGPDPSPAEIFNPDYTHCFILPEPYEPSGTQDSYGVLFLGAKGQPFGFDVAARKWHRGFDTRPGGPADVNHGASTVLLPLRLSTPAGGIPMGPHGWDYHNGSVLCVGGEGNGTPARVRIDAFDPLAGGPTGSWFANNNLKVARKHTAAVLLPDGRIVVVCGWDGTPPPSFPSAELLKAEYVDPSSGFAVTQGTTSMASWRGYHSIALLLPDGRVLVGGGRIRDSSGGPYELADYTILSPSYVDASPRPQIQFVGQKILSRQGHPDPPDNAVYTNVEVDMGELSPPLEAVMISLGSMTHSYDFSQRAVQVAITDVTTTAPPSSTYTMKVWAPKYEWAPPGYYMLFVLNQSRVPSAASIVRLR